MSDLKPTTTAEPTPQETPTPDLETVSLQGTYRIGYGPPAAGSIAPGEIYVQVPADGGAPVLFVGGIEATVVQMVPPVVAGTAATKVDEHGRVVDPKADPKADPKTDPKDDKRK